MNFECRLSFLLLLLWGHAAVKCAPGPNSRVSAEEKPKLRFNQDGKFKLVNFADLHYGEFPGTQRGREQDGNSSLVMTRILDIEQPDLVVFTGDLITGDVLFVNATGYIDLLLQPVIQGGYKWASTYGNHDNGAVVTRPAIYATESKWAGSYTQNDGTDELPGLTNYYSPVYAPDDGGDDDPAPPLLILWFFDSRGGFDPSGIKPSNVDPAVVRWFREENARLTSEYGRLPALAFFHIPTIDYEDVQEDMAAHPECVGLVDEAVVPQNTDTGFMGALLESGTVLTTFVGHDHGNGWCCLHRSLEICYNRHTGYGGYGQWERGARVVQLDMNTLWTKRVNYIRMESGVARDFYPR